MKNRIAFFDIISITLIAAFTFIFVNTVCSTPMVYASIEAQTPIGMVEMVNSEAQIEFIPDANVEIVDTEIQIVFLKQQ